MMTKVSKALEARKDWLIKKDLGLIQSNGNLRFVKIRFTS